jgi:sortase A
MTLVRTSPPAPGAREDKASSAGKSAPLRAAVIGRAVWTVASTAILILAATMLGFAVWLVAGSRLYYDRAQHDDYATLRAEMAQGTAPAGATQPGNPSKLLMLGTPVAVLTIPQIGLNAVVLEGTTGQVLEDGPGHLRDTPLPGRPGISVIMGRRASYGGPFARISSMNPGSIFTVTTGAGVSRYRVLDVRRPGDPVPLVPAGGGRLMLATADGYPFAPTGVLTVDANLMSGPKGAPAVVIPAADLLPGEKALGSDSAAVVPMVLWAEALMLAAVALSWLGSRWGRWQTRIIAIPVLGYLGLAVADQLTRLLPNVL